MKIFFIILYFVTILPFILSKMRESCLSPIYCQGDLLNTVQTSGIFNDSKTFVDMALINSVNDTLNDFNKMMAETEDSPNQEQVRAFVSRNFLSIGEMEEAFPVDFKQEPKLIKEISDPVIRQFATNIISIWPSLTRKVSSQVFEHPEMFSIIPIKNPFIIPGGRFKEYYYWDTYWIVKGLLISDMMETAKGMIENLLSMVERFGFVPNGGRIYYLNRSQPPLLTLMVSDYIKYSKDFEFLRNNVNTLEKELNFWLTRRVIEIVKNGEKYILAHYDSESDTPRPESYIEDIETCGSLDDDDKFECYVDLKSGAESGWDFTSRWFFGPSGELTSQLRNINTRRNIPVDLNSFLYKAFTTLGKFYLILQQEQSAKHWMDLAQKWKISIENVLYNEEDGIWYDYDLKLQKPRKYYFASNVTPLWAGAMDDNKKEERSTKVLEYLRKHGISNFRGGIPTSLFLTGQQWDFPNAWSPYQNLLIFGLDKTGNEEVKEAAKQLAHIWVNSNIRAFHDNKVMFEKYNAENSGQFGGGGEYQIQAGFGWSNGCVLELIDRYFRVRTRKYKGGFDY